MPAGAVQHRLRKQKKKNTWLSQSAHRLSCFKLLPRGIPCCPQAKLAWSGLASCHDNIMQGDPRSRCATRVLHIGQGDLSCRVPKSKFHLDSSADNSDLSTGRKPQHVRVIVGEGQHDASFSWVFHCELEVARVCVQQRLKVSVPGSSR